MDKLLTLEEVIEGITPIVEANPDFIYPQQGDEDERCKCVEGYNDESGWEQHDPTDCPWHMNDDNTCLYLKDGTTTAPACVLGHYFVKELGFSDVHRFEAKSPERVLDGHGYEVAPGAQRFLNSIQTSQDHGDTWEEALAGALKDAGYRE